MNTSWSERTIPSCLIRRSNKARAPVRCPKAISTSFKTYLCVHDHSKGCYYYYYSYSYFYSYYTTPLNERDKTGSALKTDIYLQTHIFVEVMQLLNLQVCQPV